MSWTQLQGTWCIFHEQNHIRYNSIQMYREQNNFNNDKIFLLQLCIEIVWRSKRILSTELQTGKWKQPPPPTTKTRMTVRALKQDTNTQTIKKNADFNRTIQNVYTFLGSAPILLLLLYSCVCVFVCKQLDLVYL